MEDERSLLVVIPEEVKKGGRCSCLRREVATSGAEVREAVPRVMGGVADLAESRMEGTSG